MLVRNLGSAVAIGAMAVTSCGNPVDVPTMVEYELILLNGVLLPVELTPLYTILTGSLVLVSDGTCQRTVRVLAPADPMTDDLVESESWWGCTWTQDESTLSFIWLDAEGNTLFPFPGTLVSASIQQGRITLIIDTGIRCIRAPCPRVGPKSSSRSTIREPAVLRPTVADMHSNRRLLLSHHQARALRLR